MNIFSRFIDIINANMNAMLEKAENPEKMLRLMIQEMEDTLIELKSSCAGSIAEGTKLKKERADAAEAAGRWEKRALLAMQNGKDDLAREAVAEKLQAEKDAERLRNLIDENESTVSEARKNISELEAKLSESKTRLRLLKEKEERARNERRTRASMDMDTEERFQDMESRVRRMETCSWTGDGQEEKFREMEKSDEIEKEMEKLRKKAGL